MRAGRGLELRTLRLFSGWALGLALVLLGALLVLQWLPTDPGIIPLDPDGSPWALAFGVFLAALLTEDLACIGAGLLVAQGQIGFIIATVVCFLGFTVGNVLLYWAGSALGHACLHRAPVSWLLTPEQVQKSMEWFQRRGPVVVFFTRFVPGTRVASYFTAGLLDIGFWRFFLYLTVSTAIWVSLLVGGTSLLGSRVLDLFNAFERWALPAVVGMALLIWLAVRAWRRQTSAGPE